MDVRLARFVRMAAIGALLAVATHASAAKEATKLVVRPVSDLKWEKSPGVPGSKIATIWGDPQKGAYGALKTIPMGVALPVHTHSREQTVILIKGMISLSVEGGPVTELGPGSYAVIPAGVKHAVNCQAGVDCLYFEEQPGAADMIPAGRSPAK